MGPSASTSAEMYNSLTILLLYRNNTDKTSMRKFPLTVAVVLIPLAGVLAGCSATPTVVESPSVSSSPVDDSGFTPIQDTENVAIQSDLEATKTRIEAALLAGTPVSSVTDLIVNSNPGLFVITVRANENNTFDVTGVNQNTMEGFTVTGQGNYNLLNVQ